LAEGLAFMAAWGFTYKSNIVWHKIRKDGGPDGRGVGFYFRNVTELVLFGVRGKNARTLAPPGRITYLSLCAGCHGLDGNGVPNTVVAMRGNTTHGGLIADGKFEPAGAPSGRGHTREGDGILRHARPSARELIRGRPAPHARAARARTRRAERRTG
jgi:hypothetical protein